MGQGCGLPDSEGETEGQGRESPGLWAPPSPSAGCGGSPCLLFPLGGGESCVCAGQRRAQVHTGFRATASRGGEHGHLCSVTGGILQHASP